MGHISRGGTIFRFATSFALYMCLIICASGLSNTSLSISPLERCEEVELQIQFSLNATLTAGDSIYVKIPGFTRGDCDNVEGGDVTELQWYGNIDDDALDGTFYEGTVADEYNSSYLEFSVQSGYTLSPNQTDMFTIKVDRVNRLKINCRFSNAEIKLETDNYYWMPNYEVFGTMDVLEGSTCYISDLELDFTPSVPAWVTEINITFIPAFPMYTGDKIYVNLGGFTSGNATGTPGDDIAMGGVIFKNGDPGFNGGWTEGEYVRGQSGYYNSSLNLELNSTYAAGDVISIIVDKFAGLRAQCGIDGDTPYWQMMVEGIAGNATWTRFDTTEAVGPGCRELDYCNDRGSCDYCNQKCNCIEGHGHPNDIQDGDIAADCSEYVCPNGIGWGYKATNATYAHPRLECSGAGSCNRQTGQCSCFVGFEGTACDRRQCPTVMTEGTDFPTACSGHGRCLPIRQLACTSEALPLSNHSEAYQGEEDAGTWDSSYIYGCLCDSSWEVGLGYNQTQEAEWFGGACEFRHCPTGDDPRTPQNETDCSGVTAAGGHGVGEQGNLCHHDCSGRGICDYFTGLCTCFDGFYGHNCGQFIEYPDVD